MAIDPVDMLIQGITELTLKLQKRGKLIMRKEGKKENVESKIKIMEKVSTVFSKELAHTSKKSNA